MKSQINRTLNEQEEISNLILDFYENISLGIDPDSKSALTVDRNHL